MNEILIRTLFPLFQTPKSWLDLMEEDATAVVKTGSASTSEDPFSKPPAGLSPAIVVTNATDSEGEDLLGNDGDAPRDDVSLGGDEVADLLDDDKSSGVEQTIEGEPDKEIDLIQLRLTDEEKQAVEQDEAKNSESPVVTDSQKDESSSDASPVKKLSELLKSKKDVTKEDEKQTESSNSDLFQSQTQNTNQSSFNPLIDFIQFMVITAWHNSQSQP